MANISSTLLRNEALQRSQVHEISLWFQQTAGTQTYLSGLEGLASAVIIGDTAGEFTQAATDTLLGSTNDILATTVFGSTAMGTDAFGVILSTGQQLKSIVYMQYSFWLATEVANCIVGTATAPTNALTEVAYCSPLGDAALRVIPAGFDAGTGLLQINLGVILK